MCMKIEIHEIFTPPCVIFLPDAAVLNYNSIKKNGLTVKTAYHIMFTVIK
jgi:hypothetical protein